MILLGEDILVLKEDGTGLLIWNTKTGGMFTLALDGTREGAHEQNYKTRFNSRKDLSVLPCYILLHTSTRLWSVVPMVTSNYGTLGLGTWPLLLWQRSKARELMKSELIHTFPYPVPAAPSAITCLVQSPAIDVIGIGYLDGNVHIFDVRQGELVMQMKMEDGSCSSLSFRTGQ